MVDYVRLKATAERLMAKNGRQLTLHRLEKTSDDALKPWRGTSDPRPGDVLTVYGVFVKPASLAHLGYVAGLDDFRIMEDDFVMLSPEGIIDTEIETYNEVVDDNRQWRIDSLQRLKPGPTIMLYLLRLKR